MATHNLVTVQTNNILIGTQSKNLSIMLIHPIRNHQPVTLPAATPYSFEKT